MASRIDSVTASNYVHLTDSWFPAVWNPRLKRATNPYLRCGSGRQCAVPHAIDNVCQSIFAARFQFLCFFCFDSWEEKSWRQMNLNWLRPFSYTRAIADCYTSPTGEKTEKKIPKKATLLVAKYNKTKVWTRCLSQPHTTWVQFFVIVFHHGCRHLGNFGSFW